jgi:hypothetical protein
MPPPFSFPLLHPHLLYGQYDDYHLAKQGTTDASNDAGCRARNARFSDRSSSWLQCLVFLLRSLPKQLVKWATIAPITYVPSARQRPPCKSMRNMPRRSR